MRISELLNEETLNEISRPSASEAEQILFRAGYKRIGYGAFGTVYGKPDSAHVLKLFMSSDIGYMEFVDLANKHPNPHFPKFKGKIMKITKDYNAIQMERLTPAQDNNETVLIARTMNNYVRLLQHKESYRQTPDETTNAMNALEESQPGIKNACSLIAHSTTREVDIHNENYMMRGKVLVITDPVAW